MHPLLNIEEIEKRLHLVFRDKNLLLLAFTHRSFWNENQERVKEHNERLEFLGDSVLGMILAEYLYIKLPLTSEGILSDLRSRLVEASSCVRYVQKLGLDTFVLLGKGEQMNRGKGRDSILADLFEAIVGAVYLDRGYAMAKEFFLKHFQKDVEAILEKPARNWKAELQDYAQKRYQEAPTYEVIEEYGPSHSKQFKVAVYIKQQKVGMGEGSSKKQAQQHAAEIALERLLP